MKATRESTISVNAIARKINLSSSTVSRALRGHPSISEATRQRVQKVAEQEGYRPNKSLQKFFKSVHRRNTTFAMLVMPENMVGGTQQRDTFFSRVFLGVQTALRARNIHLMIANAATDIMDDGNVFAVAEGVADGVIAMMPDDAAMTRLAQHAPVVVFNHECHGHRMDVVTPGISQCAFDQIDYLMARGHRRIACFRPRPAPGQPFMNWQDHQYWRTYEQHSLEQGLILPAEYLAPIRFEPYHHDEAIAAFLDRVLRPDIAPTAMVTYDLYAGGLVTQLRQRGLRVPQDVSIIGYDDCTFGFPCPIELTTFRQDFEIMANVAAQLLLDR
ncbi:MAG: LacI family DNA-binding transcriptional regulator, partial [Phycisphaeraceae bacterium]|nr:LacI family DNA-binding transcriptional regulator [Phycisphaeraceae bacterium]